MSASQIRKIPRDWISKYWQWIYSYSQGNSPLETGKISHQFSNGIDFLCFPCTGGGEDCSRTVTIAGDDAKKEILIPVFTAAYNSAELGRDLTQKELLEQARTDVRNPLSLELTLDDKALIPHYVESLPFKIVPPKFSWNNASHKEYITLSAGYWYKLGPLPSGKHTVRFGGTGQNLFHTKVQYSINIQSCYQDTG